MTFLSYLNLFKQFFFRKAHTFMVRINAVDLTVGVQQEVANSVHVPFSISLSDALTIIGLIEDHASSGPVTPLSFTAYVDGNIEVTISVSKD